jgi:hypothetical protein
LASGLMVDVAGAVGAIGAAAMAYLRVVSA